LQSSPVGLIEGRHDLRVMLSDEKEGAVRVPKNLT
jgi:hypothetical protein